MQNKLISRIAMFVTLVLAMTVFLAVPVFAATFKNVRIGNMGTCDIEIDMPSSDITLHDDHGGTLTIKGTTVESVSCRYSPGSEDDENELLTVFSLGYSSVECNDPEYFAGRGVDIINPGIKYTVSNISGFEPSSFTGRIAAVYTSGNFMLETDSKGNETISPIGYRAEGTHHITPSSASDDEDDDDADDNDDDDSSSGGMSFEERQREAGRHFAPDASTLTSEQSAGWSLVSREAPAISSGAGVAATSAYQGPMCRLVFQLAAPGYSIGHTYNMSFRSIGGNASMKVPTDLVRSGRRFVLTFVTSDGRYVSTPALTADGRGYLNFDLAGLGLTANTNNAVAIMYQD